MRLTLLGLLSLAWFAPVGAQEKETDLIFRVLGDELARSTAKLKLEKKETPYYVEYVVNESDSFIATASFGALSSRRGGKSRYVSVDCRVGNYQLDNSNYKDSSGNASDNLSIDDDYDALRKTIWLTTDAAYKASVEELEHKKAYLQQNTVKDRPDDMSKEAPVTSVGPVGKLEIDGDKWAGIVRRVSGVFRSYPRIQKSSVILQAETTNRWFLNSEGFKSRRANFGLGFFILAMTQADDGMKISDAEIFAVNSEKDMPSAEALEKSARDLAERIIAVADAPQIDEEYLGPILLEGQPSAEFFQQILVPNLGASHEVLGRGNANSGNQWREKINQKVMPGFLSVTSDPTAKEFGGTTLEAYETDDDGVKSQKLALVEKGFLKTFCMSRIPTRAIRSSNGHSRGGVGTPATLFIQSTKTMPAAKMREKLIELGKEEQMKYVYVARRTSTGIGFVLDQKTLQNAARASAGGLFLMPPVALYRVNVETGKEELIRGARYGKLTLRILRDIDSTGDDMKVHAVLQGQRGTQVVCPSLLIKEIEIIKPGKEMEKAPSLPNPFFDQKK